ncbi:hypothetical protein [Nocardia mexicana]|uniref:Uncharacterized protein n=1 Tax=Nocardia mexicana TaxID=279262 RepID=A0A370H7Q9_9NOCA|nr:hypothetical protein [Nocardia mexicana]RDI52688.1 hypothetical protein DFR68_10372 [Nocardia mexicana]
MYQTVRIDGHPYQVLGSARLSLMSRACYGKYRFTLRRVSDGSLWTAFGAWVTPASELVRSGSPAR